MATQTKQDQRTEIEATTQEIGSNIWDRITHRRPSMFDRRWLDDQILSWAMADESIKVQMFRFVDVLPMLKTSESINRHLHEYFEEVKEHLPWAARLGLQLTDGNHVLGRALAYNARTNTRRMAERFIAGQTVEEVSQAVHSIRNQGFAFTLDLLGEAVISETEAEAYQQQYLKILEGLSPQLNQLPESAQVDCDHWGPIPRLNVSLKLSALVSHFAPVDAKGTAERVKERLRVILRKAAACHAFVNIDMEQYSYKSLTLQIFQEILMEEEFRETADVGIVIQAYLPDAEKDLKKLLKWVKKRGTPVWVRLVKGAYWDYETIQAGLRNWPVPVYQQKWESDANYERQIRFLLENYEWLHPAFGSHNLRNLSHAMATAQHLDVPQDAFEIQMLYGMGHDQAQAMAEMDYRVRVYTPFGDLIPGMAYLVRRLLENTSNDSFLRHSYDTDITIEDLLMPPKSASSKKSSPKTVEEPQFQNEPLTDFSIEENRDLMQQALDEVNSQLGQDYPAFIDGKSYDTRQTITSRSPSDRKVIVGRTASATSDLAIEAIQVSRRALTGWADMDANHRCEYLELVARELAENRFELAAWEVYECGKPWEEADADIAEAIDFCRYYSQEYLKLSESSEVNLPGEENLYQYRSRGVCVVIAPWNFPLAILTGMTAAAMVTGNTVIMKPAEQSSVVAAKFMELIHRAGVPSGVVNYLPGVGEEIGPELVGSPDVDMIAFTGSREVGLEIYQQASSTDSRQQTIKKVVAEMGGKNAIIIDEDADLDEAVLGVVASAFGYSGQKCSACSRAIVLNDVYDAFTERLQGAVESLHLGPADDPGTQVGPVIDEDARDRIQEYLDIAAEEGELLVGRDVSDLTKTGEYIGPHVYTGINPQDRIAQEEIFGPVLAVIKARDFSDALKIANETEYALTGGIYSRSPENLKRARQEFRVGNLYLNRPCTGALVQRQPFGGYQMSGIGTKAGGPDYLQQFMIPITITENTMRRGFAPSKDS